MGDRTLWTKGRRLSRTVPILRNYAELARISNAPTVITNALVGCAFAAGGAPLAWEKVTAACVAMMLLYIAGMALNDAVDAEVDAVERPERPIPSGRISRRAAIFFSIACLLAGLAILAMLSAAALVWGGVLAAVIVAYDLLHRLSAWAVLLMGACRGLVYLAGAAAIAWPTDIRPLLIFAGITTLHVIALSVVARREAGGELGWRRWLALAAPLIVLGWAGLIQVQGATEPARPFVLAMLAAGWIAWFSAQVWRQPPRVVPAVMGWLAGICLIDASFLAFLAWPSLAIAALAFFGLTVLAQRRILGS